jgi:hypothetical protein
MKGLARTILAGVLTAWLAWPAAAYLFSGGGGGGGGGTPAHSSQAANNIAGPATTISATLGTAVPAGGLIIATVCYLNMDAFDTITMADDKSNTWTPLMTRVISGSGPYGCLPFYAFNVSGGPSVITATFPSNSVPAIFVDSFTNIAATSPVDGTPVGANPASPGTGTDAVSSGNTTTAVNGDLIYGMGISIHSSGLTVGTGFTGYVASASTWYTESKIQSSAGAVAATFTATSGTDVIIAMVGAFKHL